MTSVVRTPIFVMSGFSGFNENSAVHMRDDSSGQRTVKISAEAETVIGPGRTPEMSAGTKPATLSTGMKKMRHRIVIGLKDFILTLRRLCSLRWRIRTSALGTRLIFDRNRGNAQNATVNAHCCKTCLVFSPESRKISEQSNQRL